MRKFWITSCLLLLGTGFFAQSVPQVLQLQEKIAAAEQHSNVSAREVIDLFWELAELHTRENRLADAYAVIIAGLKHDPWAFRYQLEAGQYESSIGQNAKANSRFHFIVDNLDANDPVQQAACQLLMSQAVREPESRPTLPGKYLYLAAYPCVDYNLVALMAGTISREFGLSVRIAILTDTENPRLARDARRERIEEIAQSIIANNPADILDTFLADLGMSWTDVKTPDGKSRFVYHVLDQSEQGRSHWRFVNQLQPQYNADSLLEQLAVQLQDLTLEADCLGYIALTAFDIYAQDYNYLFGWTRPGSGIISYWRFLSDRPGQDQFYKRTFMQVLSSAGFVLGIPRCTQARCARAYPHSLEEQDRKQLIMCSECLENLEKLYRKLQ